MPGIDLYDVSPHFFCSHDPDPHLLSGTRATSNRPRSSEANIRLGGQEIPHLCYNPKFHCCVYKNPPPVHILNLLNTFHTVASYRSNNWFNIILSLTPMYSTQSLSFVFSAIPFSFLPWVLHAPSSLLRWFRLRKIWQRVEIMAFFIAVCVIFSSFLSRPLPLLSIRNRILPSEHSQT